MRGPRAALLALVVLTAGCAAPTAPPSTDAQTTASPTASPTTDAPTATDHDPSTPTETGESVEYVVSAGDVPEALSSATVTLQVVYVEQTSDLGPCYPEIFSGPYKPTITPLRRPEGECERTDPVEIDVTEIESGRTVVADTAPAWAEGHALIVTGATATDGNGTQVALKNAGGFDVLVSESPPGGTYRGEIRLGEGPDGASYDYWIGGRSAE